MQGRKPAPHRLDARPGGAGRSPPPRTGRSADWRPPSAPARHTDALEETHHLDLKRSRTMRAMRSKRLSSLYFVVSALTHSWRPSSTSDGRSAPLACEVDRRVESSAGPILRVSTQPPRRPASAATSRNSSMRGPPVVAGHGTDGSQCLACTGICESCCPGIRNRSPAIAASGILSE